jgi:hypothetical protein
MQFGDLIHHQICGVAMGILPAPTIANLYVAIYKLNHSIPLLEKYLVFYKRFINNGFAIWLHNLHPTTNTNNWNDFKALLNTMGLRWTFKSPRKKLIFMDMTIQVKRERITTTIYAKPLAPRLCILSEFRGIPMEFGKKAPTGTECDRNGHQDAL